MSQSSVHKKKRKRIIEANPRCYFCGGQNVSTTIDHVPPRACFLDTHFPEDFEFAACKICNEGAMKSDQIFGLYSMCCDFDQSKWQNPDYKKKFDRLHQGIRNNYPDALLDLQMTKPIYPSLLIYTPTPIMFDVTLTPAIQDALTMTGAKLIHALYLKETGKILSASHKAFAGIYQPQREGFQGLTAYFESVLPNSVIGNRSNIKNYGERFMYMSGYNSVEDFFVYAAQFGHGLIVWGVAYGEGIEPPKEGPFGINQWQACASGAGYTNSGA